MPYDIARAIASQQPDRLAASYVVCNNNSLAKIIIFVG
jgi:hypothetical protein